MKEARSQSGSAPGGAASPSLLSRVAPGILVAATGVGAGDLLTASLGGSALGTALVWAALCGAILKWFLNEGIARWQMATGTTLLEGWVTHLGGWIRWAFLGYLVLWTIPTGGAIVSACGVAATGLLPLSDDLNTSKIIWGFVHSFAGLALVLVGGFKLFEKLMSACIAVMFAAVIATAVLMKPDWSAVAAGAIPRELPRGESLGWVLGVLGGVGGTLTLLSYGYWIREEGRSGEEGVRACRFDLALGYLMTALFGVCMIVIGSRLTLSRGPGALASLALDLAGQLEMTLGAAGKWIFLVGFWGAVFSSLLGVWQSVPYMFADFLRLCAADTDGDGRPDGPDVPLAKTDAYKAYLVAITIAPLPLLFFSLKQVQLAYAILGALFMPLLALTLLILNNRRSLVDRFRSGVIANLALLVTLGFFGAVGYRKIASKLGEVFGS